MRVTTRRPLAPAGFPIHPDGDSFTFPVRIYGGSGFIDGRADLDMYRVVLAHKWREDSGGYCVTTVYDTEAKRATHLALHHLVTMALPGMVIDHKYGNRLDNRRCVLRVATSSENAANTRLDRRGRSSRYRGVTLHPSGRWQAQLKRHERNHYLGLFKTEEAAAAAYNVRAKATWGPFAQLNRLPKSSPEAA